MTGRPSDYQESFAKTARFLCSTKYASDADLAEVFGVSLRTIMTWKKDKPEFSAAIREGKDAADSNVERCLYERATGYSVEEEKVFCTKDGNIVTHKTVKRFPPDAVSMIFWLKNRQRERWRDKQEVEHKGTGLSVNVNVGLKKPDVIENETALPALDHEK